MKTTNKRDKVLFFVGRFIFIGLGMMLGNFLISKIQMIVSSLAVANSIVSVVLNLIPLLTLVASGYVLWRFFPSYETNPALAERNFMSWVGINYIGESFLVGIILIVAMRSCAILIAWLWYI